MQIIWYPICPSSNQYTHKGLRFNWRNPGIPLNVAAARTCVVLRTGKYMLPATTTHFHVSPNVCHRYSDMPPIFNKKNAYSVFIDTLTQTHTQASRHGQVQCLHPEPSSCWSAHLHFESIWLLLLCKICILHTKNLWQQPWFTLREHIVRRLSRDESGYTWILYSDGRIIVYYITLYICKSSIKSMELNRSQTQL